MRKRERRGEGDRKREKGRRRGEGGKEGEKQHNSAPSFKHKTQKNKLTQCTPEKLYGRGLLLTVPSTVIRGTF